MLFVNAAAHLLVDMLCACTLFGPVHGEESFVTLLFLYNTLAFSTQCLVGLAADRIKRHGIAAAASMLLVVLGFVVPGPALLKVILIGLGNSVFHVAGGAMTLEGSRGKAAPLGVFVAPGAIGLALGTLFPQLGYIAAALLALAVGLELVLLRRSAPAPEPIPVRESAVSYRERIIAMLLLTLAVAVRAIGGTAVSFPWKTGAWLTLLTVLCVFLGKTAGGFIMDRFGARLTALVSIPLAALLIAFCSKWMLPSLVGQFALNLTMPVTLFLMYLAVPDQPGFAFGLAASALWPGTIVGQLMTLTGPALWALVLVSFLFCLFAVLCALRLEKDRPRHAPLSINK